jgi:hypothetical protein
LVSTPADQQRHPASSVIDSEGGGPAPPSSSAPSSPAASEADLVAAEQQLRGMLDMTREYFRTS